MGEKGERERERERESVGVMRLNCSLSSSVEVNPPQAFMAWCLIN
jgi:hypothetical protein